MSRLAHFFKMSCFFCSSEVGKPIYVYVQMDMYYIYVLVCMYVYILIVITLIFTSFCLWSYIIFSTIPLVSPSKSDS